MEARTRGLLAREMRLVAQPLLFRLLRASGAGAQLSPALRGPSTCGSAGRRGLGWRAHALSLLWLWVSPSDAHRGPRALQGPRPVPCRAQLVSSRWPLSPKMGCGPAHALLVSVFLEGRGQRPAFLWSPCSSASRTRTESLLRGVDGLSRWLSLFTEAWVRRWSVTRDP